MRLKENLSPKYFKPRPIPFSLHSKVENKLEKLIMEGVLFSVNCYDWGTPIVPVLKKNDDIQICGKSLSRIIYISFTKN